MRLFYEYMEDLFANVQSIDALFKLLEVCFGFVVYDHMPPEDDSP